MYSIGRRITFLLILFVLTLVGMRALFGHQEQDVSTVRIPEVSPVLAQDFQKLHSSLRSVGTVEALSQVDLTSSIQEQVTGIRVSIGDVVQEGQELVTLDSSRLRADLLREEATLQAERARLSELLRGTRPEELRLTETKATNARVALNQTKDGLRNQIVQSFTKSDDAVRNHIDQLFHNPRSSSLSLKFVLSDSSLENALRDKRRALEIAILDFQSHLETASFEEARSLLLQTQSLLASAALTVNGLTSSLSLSDTQIATYRSSISGARTSINTQLSSLLQAEEKVRVSEGALGIAGQELSLAEAGASSESIEAEEARVLSAEARVSSLKSLLRNTSITAPIEGKIASLSVDVGETLSPGAPVVSIVNPDGLQITTFVNSKDAPLVLPGSSVEVEGGISGLITRVAPRIHPETRKVEVSIAVLGPQSRDLFVGELVNVDIEISEEGLQPSYFLPLSALQVTPQETYVLTVSPNDTVEFHPVVVGDILGDRVQVVSGISPDFLIISFARGLTDGQTVRVR